MALEEGGAVLGEALGCTKGSTVKYTNTSSIVSNVKRVLDMSMTMYYEIANETTLCEMSEKETTHDRRSTNILEPVSYTHLTLPTIYSV